MEEKIKSKLRDHYTNNTVGSLSKFDRKRWTKQHFLFKQIKERNVKVYNDLIKKSIYMNGHALDMINIAINESFKMLNESKDSYPLRAIFSDRTLAALFLNDKDFVNATKDEKNGEYLTALRKDYQ